MFHSQSRIPRGVFFRLIVPLNIMCSLILIASTSLFAGQPPRTVGFNADITGGGNGPDLSVQNISQAPNRYVGFYGSFPSVSFKARGEHSSLDSNYAFGYNWNGTDPSYETKSHSASLGYTANLNEHWKLNLADQFFMTSDVSTFKLLSGGTTDAEQFQYVFTPIFLRSSQSNVASIGMDRNFNKKSYLTINGSYSTLDYPNNSLTTGILSDQQRIAATITYNYKGERNSWSIGYSGAQMNFVSFENSRNHAAIFGFSHQFTPVLSFSIDVGPSYLETLEEVKSPVGANVTLSVKRVVRKGSFNVMFKQTSGDTSGLGSVSTYRNLDLTYNRTFGKDVSLAVTVSGFDSQGLQVNAFSARGISAGGSMAYALGRTWSLAWGGQYQHYAGYHQTADYDQKRAFMSLRYSNPELWRF